MNVISVRVDLDRVIHDRFGGAGFHRFISGEFPPGAHAETFHRRWEHLRPSFVRVDHNRKWDRAQLDQFADILLRMQAVGTQIYVTTWNPLDVAAGEGRRAYAEAIVDHLEHLIRGRGCTSIRWYCMANELSLRKWGDMIVEMETFADYHRELYGALRRRGLDVALLASDASPHARWVTVDWCTEHMDDVTGVYGAHHYFNEHPPNDAGMYAWWLNNCRQAVAAARSRGKDFIIGEFGPAQNQGQRTNQGNWDGCRHWDTPLEPLVGTQLGDAAAAMLNTGVYAWGYWTFADGKDPVPPSNYWNQWGLFRNSGDDLSVRPVYQAYGLLTRYLRSGSQVVACEASDTLVRAAALRRGDACAVLLVNRGETATIELALSRPTRGLRVHLYDPASVAMSEELAPPVDLHAAESTTLQVAMPPQSVAVVTNEP